MMALTKFFVVVFLVYLNFDISPLDSAAIPERLDSPHSINENDENSEIYTTTGATEEDIEKIFETYENLYIKNSNWFNDDELTKNANNEKLSETQLEDETTLRDLGTTEPTADDVVESIHNIMDEKIDAKKNRTDRTIVVVVTTNVFNINGSDESNKRQHTLLSFGTPGMLQKETSTDPTLAMHSKITTEFFNSNPSPIVKQPDPFYTADNEVSIAEDADANVLDDSIGDSDKPDVTEAKDVPDISATEQPRSESGDDNDQDSNIDIRRLDASADMPIANLIAKPESRSFDDELTNDNSNDVLRIMKIISNRSVDDQSTGSLSQPIEIPYQEPQDSSLMEAIENILDTDVRKAFERDIPQTHHVPLDINIEEEALYAPLKDLSEYIVEEVPINGNYELFTDNKTVDDKIDKVDDIEEIGRKLAAEYVEEVESVRKTDHVNENKETDNVTDEPVTEVESKMKTTTTTTTTEEPTVASITEDTTPKTKITGDKETKTTAAEEAELIETTATTITAREDDETTVTTDGPVSNDAREEQSEDINENEEESITSTATVYSTFKAPTIDNKIEAQDEKLSEEDLERVETIQKSNSLDAPVLSDDDELPNGANNDEAKPIAETIAEEAEPIAENESDVQDQVTETLRITFPDGESTPIPIPVGPQDTFVPESSLSPEAQIELQSVIGTYEKLVDQSFDEYPIYVQLDTTTEFITNPNLYIGASFSGKQVAAILEEAERAKTASHVQIYSSTPDDVEFMLENELVYTPTQSSFIDAVPSQGEVSPLIDLEDRLVEDTPDATEEESDEAQDNLNENEHQSNENEDKLTERESRLLLERVVLDRAIDIETAFERRIEGVGLGPTAKPHGEDVVSEVVKVDEETTEQHQIIKKPGVDDISNGTSNVELKTINVTNVESNHLVASAATNFESRSFGDNDDPVDPLRTLVEAVELTADITKTVDNFQSFIDPNDSIHLAANQVVEDRDDMELVDSVEELKVAQASVWLGAATYIYVAGGVLATGLIVLLGVVSYFRFRQFKRNILFYVD